MTADTHRIALSVSEMSCTGCSSRVEKALRSVPGVKEAHVDLDSASATVETEADGPSIETLIAAVEKVGYEAKAAG
jgi:copper chaperone CopZ